MYYRVAEQAAELIAHIYKNRRAIIRFMLQSRDHRSALIHAFLLLCREKVHTWLRPDELGAGPEVRSRRPFAKPVLRGLVVATVSIAAVAFVLTHLSVSTRTGERAGSPVCTGIGEIRNLPLEDGSTIELTTRTCVEVLVSMTKREARLLQGEALFTVHHDERRPFTLFTPHVVVEDLGTQFRVYEHEDETDIGVLQGEVSIRARSTPRFASQPPVHLGPGEGATAVSGQNTVTIRAEKLSRGEIERALAWRQGALEFHGNSLKDAVSEINRYNVRQLVIADPAIENMSVGGRLRYSDFDGAVETIADALGIHVSVDETNPNIMKLSGSQRRLEERYGRRKSH